MRADNLIFLADFPSHWAPGFSTRLSTHPGNLPSADVCPRALASSAAEPRARTPRLSSSSHGNTGIAYFSRRFMKRKERGNGGGNGGWSADDQRMHSYDRVRQRGIGRHSSLRFKFWYEYDIGDGRE